MERLLAQIANLKGLADAKELRKLKLTLLERVAKRLGQFSGECRQCVEHLEQLNTGIKNIKIDNGMIEKACLKEYQIILQKTITHLQKIHKLVTQGFYAGIYMSIGVGLGVPIGLALNNISLGIPIGLCIGLAIGSSLDLYYEKKGLVI